MINYKPLSQLDSIPFILASASPRRQDLFAQLGLEFKICVKPNIDEEFPIHLTKAEIPRFLAEKKAEHYGNEIKQGNFLITADTIVWHKGEVLGKPTDRDDAIAILSRLSNSVHHVFSGVCLRYKETSFVFDAHTEVSFKALKPDEISFYIDRYKPYDKAGAYGIQEWIGYVAVESIKGSYFNVMGLPIHQLYEALNEWKV